MSAPVRAAGARRRRPCPRGFSLVELLVALVIGLVVVGALLAAYLAAAQSRAGVDAALQMSDDAGAALQVLRQHVAMAGYRAPAAAAASSTPPWPAVYGCNGGSGWAGGTQAPIEALGPCGAATPGPDWLAVAYQVDVDTQGPRPTGNAMLAPDQAPYDCAGNALVADGGTYRMDAHFYVARSAATGRPALYCRQGGTAPGVAGQVVADNVADFQVRYLLSASGRPGQAAWYSDAPDDHAGAGSRFEDVVALRLCVEVTSGTPLADRRRPEPYVGCDDRPHAAVDGYLHRVFTTTVVLQNRAAGPGAAS